MFERQFGLRENPFVAGHQSRFVYPSREHQEALAHLRFGIENREPFVLITGEVGTGKTTALYDVLAEYESRAIVALITNSALTRDELMEEICLRFGIALSGPVTKPRALAALERFLRESHAQGHRAILILDEAQNLDRDLLEEIRLLSNLEVEGEKLVQLFLVGQPELEEKLGRTELRQLRQRITVFYRLSPLSQLDTERYIHHRITVAGGHAISLFPAESCREVHRITHGIPREINTVAGQAMLNAYVEDSPAVLPEHVQMVELDSEFKSVLRGGSQGARISTLETGAEQAASAEQGAAAAEAPGAGAAPVQGAGAGRGAGAVQAPNAAQGSGAAPRASAAPVQKAPEPAAKPPAPKRVVEAPAPRERPAEAQRPAAPPPARKPERPAAPAAPARPVTVAPPAPATAGIPPIQPPVTATPAPVAGPPSLQTPKSVPAPPSPPAALPTGPPRFEVPQPPPPPTANAEPAEEDSFPGPESSTEDTPAGPAPVAPAGTAEAWGSWLSSLADTPSSAQEDEEEHFGEHSEEPTADAPPMSQAPVAAAPAPQPPVPATAAPSEVPAPARPVARTRKAARAEAARAKREADYARAPRRLEFVEDEPPIAEADNRRQLIWIGVLLAVAIGAVIYTRPGPFRRSHARTAPVPAAAPAPAPPPVPAAANPTASAPSSPTTAPASNPAAPPPVAIAEPPRTNPLLPPVAHPPAPVSSGPESPAFTPAQVPTIRVAQTTATHPTSSPPVAPAPPKPNTAPRGDFVLVVGTYPTEDQAEQARAKLAAATQLPTQVLMVPENDASMFRVYVGAFDDRHAAEQMASSLIERGLVEEARVASFAEENSPKP
ncbi:MAG TPA: AAA family ATPase [Candidatus Eisenbacteria bacterium]|jgi:general secretion pathway protein A